MYPKTWIVLVYRSIIDPRVGRSIENVEVSEGTSDLPKLFHTQAFWSPMEVEDGDTHVGALVSGESKRPKLGLLRLIRVYSLPFENTSS